MFDEFTVNLTEITEVKNVTETSIKQTALNRKKLENVLKSGKRNHNTEVQVSLNNAEKNYGDQEEEHRPAQASKIRFDFDLVRSS